MQDLFTGVMSALLLSSLAGAQDVDVPGNLTMVESTATEGNILKDGIPFLHNFGTGNTFLGSNAGNLKMRGQFNTGAGESALSNNTIGHSNTASGAGALESNTSGFSNTASGAGALESNTSGFSNTASGWRTLQSNTTGQFNTGAGAFALWRNTTGIDNTASGWNALGNNTTGNLNTADGYGALAANTTGGFNTASGRSALYGNSTGIGNTGTGYSALGYNTTGSFNTAIGFRADVPFGSNLTNATAIGYQATVNASNKVRVGNALVTVIEGEVGFTASSDRNKKENPKAIDGEKVLGKIRGLTLTSWNFIGHDPKQFRHYGPMAQDFFAAFGDDGIGKIGTPTTITSTDIDGILMVAAQALEKRTEALRAENADLKARLGALERKVGGDALTRAQ